MYFPYCVELLVGLFYIFSIQSCCVYFCCFLFQRVLCAVELVCMTQYKCDMRLFSGCQKARCIHLSKSSREGSSMQKQNISLKFQISISLLNKASPPKYTQIYVYVQEELDIRLHFLIWCNL